MSICFSWGIHFPDISNKQIFKNNVAVYFKMGDVIMEMLQFYCLNSWIKSIKRKWLGGAIPTPTPQFMLKGHTCKSLMQTV